MATNSDQPSFILTVTCQAMVGVVAAITGFLASREAYIAEMAQYDDEATGRFFFRVVFRLDPERSPDIDAMQTDFAAVADKFHMQWRMRDAGVPTRTVILVSKADHCLDDLLYRRRKGELFIDIVAVVSNHQDLRAMAEREGIRFVHLPITPETKAQQESRLLELVEETDAELVVLARYMQILSPSTTEALAGRCINIHHSFLPGFKGARPYHQAWERGVKLIGATAHYVTSNLDEGPIIEQVVDRVDHTFQPRDLIAAGRDMENVALARAVRYHIERRVFVDGNKTVVFR